MVVFKPEVALSVLLLRTTCLAPTLRGGWRSNFLAPPPRTAKSRPEEYRAWCTRRFRIPTARNMPQIVLVLRPSGVLVMESSGVMATRCGGATAVPRAFIQ